jgi:hypothetical protein
MVGMYSIAYARDPLACTARRDSNQRQVQDELANAGADHAQRVGTEV